MSSSHKVNRSFLLCLGLLKFVQHRGTRLDLELFSRLLSVIPSLPGGLAPNLPDLHKGSRLAYRHCIEMHLGNLGNVCGLSARSPLVGLDPLGREPPLTFIVPSLSSRAVLWLVKIFSHGPCIKFYDSYTYVTYKGVYVVQLISLPTSTRIQGVYSFIHQGEL